MKRMNWLLSGTAALLLGCGGDTASTTKTTATPPSKPVESSTTVQPKAKESVKLPPADVPEPPPPKAVTDKDKKETATAETESAPAVPKPAAPAKKDG